MSETHGPGGVQFDQTSHENFVSYYEEESLSAATHARFSSVMQKILRLIDLPERPLDVLDIGCGAGTQCRLWAARGDCVFGVDINKALISIAKARAENAGLSITFEVGNATQLSHSQKSMDVCLLPELLEHVQDWRACLSEAIRVLRPGGVLYLSTTNTLCPMQNEFDLPLYSWYPRWLKRHYERLAVTTRPELVAYARYPAVHWFTPYGLARFLGKRGLRCFDRFDLIEATGLKKTLAHALRVQPFRLVGHMLTRASVLFAVKLD